MCKEIQANDDFYKHLVSSILGKGCGEINSKHIFRMRTYIEQGGICPYCGKSLGNIHNVLCNDENYVDVEHILPRSRSHDNSENNKILAHTKCNSAKGNQTPYEYLNIQQWKNFVYRVSNMEYLPEAKKRNLLNVWFGQEDKIITLFDFMDPTEVMQDYVGFVNHLSARISTKVNPEDADILQVDE